MYNWHIERISRNRMEDDTPSTETVQSDNLTAIERFVREVISNCRDSWIGGNNEHVQVEFNFYDLTGNEKAEFLEKIGFNSILPALESISRDRTKLDRIMLGIKPENLLNPEFTLRLLCISDNNTKGLIGPEFWDDEYEDNSDLRFISLCRSIGRNSTSGSGDNSGSWGYGKSVLWANNHTRLVLFNSILATPWNENGVTINSRLIGHAMLPDFMSPQGESHALSGKIYFGQDADERNEVKSVINDDVNEFTENLGIDCFKRENPGTSILLLGFMPNDGSEYTTEKIVYEFKHSLEKFFWPAILNDELVVKLNLNDEEININPKGNADLKPFIKAYDKAMLAPSDDKHFKLIDVRGPPSEYGFDAKIALYSQEVNECVLINKIAKIRGTKMVIEYADARISSVSGIGAAGVALAGEIINELPGIDSDQQQKLGKLLLLSEPISHHKWDDRSKKLRRYRASTAIRTINSKIVNEFRKMVQDAHEEPVGEYSTLLSKLLNLEGGGEGPGVRGGDVIYHTLIDMKKVRVDDNSYYDHSIVFKTKKKSEWKKVESTKQPTHFNFKATFKAVDESGKNLEMEEDLVFNPQNIQERVYENENYSYPIQENTIQPNKLYEPFKLDQYYREYEIKWKSREIPTSLADVLRIQANYIWQKGRETI